MLLLPILNYHHVGIQAEPSGHRHLWVSTEQFSQHLEFLAQEGYRCLTLRDCLPYLTGSAPLLQRTVALTFDDGYSDFLDHAYPILKQHGFSATVAIVTGTVGESSQWDRCWESPLMGWDDITTLSRAGVEFASHTVSHLHLTRLSSDLIRQEFDRSRHTLEQRLGIAITTLVYPYGEVNAEIEKTARLAGYNAACSDIRGNHHRPSDRFRLKRVPMHEFITVDRLRRRLSWWYEYGCLAQRISRSIRGWSGRWNSRNPTGGTGSIVD
ncbi:polysaccharide deacetylase family protein [Petrachloros mirabilis]